MAHKVHPFVFRLGTTTQWPSRWFARKQAFSQQLHEDHDIRAFFVRQLKDAALNRVDIERSRGTITVTLHTAKPGVVIGRSGAGIEELRKKATKRFFPMQRGKVVFNVAVQEVARPGVEAQLVAQGVVQDLERRMAFRRVLKMTLERVRKAGALGARICVSGRLNGAEIARTEKLGWGKIPLTNLRADIDYASVTARTIAGSIGVKVWIYRGDIFAQDRLSHYQPNTPSRPGRSDRSDRRDGGRRPSAPRSMPVAAPAPEVSEVQAA
jgi:small subunit ribosomal protein S3